MATLQRIAWPVAALPDSGFDLLFSIAREGGSDGCGPIKVYTGDRNICLLSQAVANTLQVGAFVFPTQGVQVCVNDWHALDVNGILGDMDVHQPQGRARAPRDVARDGKRVLAQGGSIERDEQLAVHLESVRTMACIAPSGSCPVTRLAISNPSVSLLGGSASPARAMTTVRRAGPD